MYSPEEDSYLLAENVKNYIFSLKNIKKDNFRVLDMCSGTGIQAKTCINLGIKRENILCADIDKEAIKYLKEQKLKAIRSNLFSDINKKNKFNLIIFNAPYLPEDRYDNKKDNIQTTAGKKGYELIIKFLKQASQYLKEEGRILLLFSSLSKPKIIIKEAKRLNYNSKKISEKNIFFEKILIYTLFKRIST